jgi:hypothetical protein
VTAVSDAVRWVTSQLPPRGVARPGDDARHQDEHQDERTR